MNFNAHLESSYFKVKQSQKFKEEVEAKIEAESLEVFLDPEGVKIFATNIFSDEHDLEKIIQENLAKDQIATIIRIALRQAGDDLGTTLSVVSELAINIKDGSTVIEEMKRNLLPRYVKAVDNVWHSEEGLWIEAGEKYLVLDSCGEHFIIQHENGKKVKWAQGEFNE